MQKLNYQHLFYFWQVAKVGSITKACDKIGLAQPTISNQITLLEKSLGIKLFRKSGRNIILTEKGELAFNFATEIFSLGQQLTRAITDQQIEKIAHFSIGFTKSMDEVAIGKIIEPILNERTRISLTVMSEKMELIYSAIQNNIFDFIISDWKVIGKYRNKIFDTPLGTSYIAIYAPQNLVEKYNNPTPSDFKDAPFILPTSNLEKRKTLNGWFEDNSLTPKIVAESEDSSLIKHLSSAGLGMIFLPLEIQKEISMRYGLAPIYTLENITTTYYLLSSNKMESIVVIHDIPRKSVVS